ncbi:MAG TPA: type II toxin-antitoxin system VapC family toxin [Thermoanaerobaculia bacterium]|nr:type II toxin-antitoxin system VapC family toxin [Thermoanaerobaculia bacterium]
MLPKTYIETSVISYLTARPSRDQIATAHQELTRGWWDRRRTRFDIYDSELVVQEAARGDSAFAKARLESIVGYPVLVITPAARALADTILQSAVLPSKAAADALHIALAAVNGMNFLVTWNCTHIANGFILQGVNTICRSAGLEPPIVCTPEELMEG